MPGICAAPIASAMRRNATAMFAAVPQLRDARCFQRSARDLRSSSYDLLQQLAAGSWQLTYVVRPYRSSSRTTSWSSGVDTSKMSQSVIAVMRWTVRA